MAGRLVSQGCHHSGVKALTSFNKMDSGTNDRTDGPKEGTVTAPNNDEAPRDLPQSTGYLIVIRSSERI